VPVLREAGYHPQYFTERRKADMLARWNNHTPQAARQSTTPLAAATLRRFGVVLRGW
jgi:hypothetical protein